MLYLNFLFGAYALSEAYILLPTDITEETTHAKTKYMVHEKTAVDEPLLFNSQGTIRLERILFAWNLAELIQWKNGMSGEIKASVPDKEGGRGGRGELVLNEDGIGGGLGPLSSDSFNLMLAWYDSMPEWEHIRMPQRLLDARVLPYIAAYMDT